MEQESGGLLSQSNQTLFLAFFFGLLFQAGLASFLLFLRNHVRTIFREGPRLALVSFIFFGGLLWPQLGFGALLVPNQSSTCRGVLIFQIIADQLARCSIEQFLLWKLTEGTKVSLIALIMQGILLVRLVAGGVLVGFLWPAFTPTCVVEASLIPASIVVLSLDIVIVAFLTIRSFALGIFKNLQTKSTTDKRQSIAFISTTICFVIWTGASAVMILGLPKSHLLVKMGAPANTLLLLLSVVTIFAESLLSSRATMKVTSEAQSPYIMFDGTREMISGNGTPTQANMFGQRKGSLVVVNQSPLDGPLTVLNTTSHGLPNQSEDRGYTNRRLEQPEMNETDRTGNNRVSSGVFGAIVNPTILKSPGKVLVSGDLKESSSTKHSFFNWSKSSARTPVRNLEISRPIAVDNDPMETQPFARVPTIDLATAQQNEINRRQADLVRMKTAASSMASTRHIDPLRAGTRKIDRLDERPDYQDQSMLVPRVQAVELSGSVTTSSADYANPSPSPQEVRRRSPQAVKAFDLDIDDKRLFEPITTKNGLGGLPSNPRARKYLSTKLPPVQRPTVMLLDESIYDSSPFVGQVSEDTTSSLSKTRPKTSVSLAPQPLTPTLDDTGMSVIHRPRPLKRDFKKDRAIFPAQPYSRHKRSRSTPLVLTSRSSLNKSIGEIPGIPLRSNIPRTAAELKKILPATSTKMSLDEKVQLLFPAPPMSHLPKRRSSVPSIPRIPSLFMVDIAEIREDLGETNNRASRRTTIASLAQLSVSSIHHHSQGRIGDAYQRKTSFHEKAGQDIMYQGGQWEVKLSLHDDSKDVVKARRQSGSTDTGSTDGLSTDWGSIHSAVPRIDINYARQNARSTYIKGVSLPKQQGKNESFTDNVFEDTIPVILDSGKVALGDTKRFLQNNLSHSIHPHFHHRVGEVLPPTFSRRESKHRVRKMPPPPPLLLYNIGRATNIVIQATEPSPVSSPEVIIAQINAQLDRLDAESVGQSLPIAQVTGVVSAKLQDRMQLLENLEREMLDIEKLQIEMGRRSMSTASSTPMVSPQPPPKVSLMSQMILNRNSYRFSHDSNFAESAHVGLKSLDSKGSFENLLHQNSEKSRASLWQRRLAEAQIAYAENRISGLRNSTSFLPASTTRILSPTPPESATSESDGEMEIHVKIDTKRFESHEPELKPQNSCSLWKSVSRSIPIVYDKLWCRPVASLEMPISPKNPARSSRPKRRLDQSPLQISSTALWTKPLPRNLTIHSGLWVSDVQGRALPFVTQRLRLSIKPTRRRRPLTLLPDIIESPVPMPNKKDTLGIYQFPWGETSDQAVYQPAYAVPLPSFPINGFNTSSSSIQSQGQSAEYTSSFFDDYEDDESGDEEANYVDSDDEFDDSTLYEIADLLRSDQVPSRQSLFSPDTFVRDFSDEFEYQSGSDIAFPSPRASLPPLKLPIPPLDLSNKTPVPSPFFDYTDRLQIGAYQSSVEDTTSKSGSDYGYSSEDEETGDIVFDMQDFMSGSARPEDLVAEDLPALSAYEPLPALQYKAHEPSLLVKGSEVLMDPSIQPPSLLWTLPVMVVSVPSTGLFSKQDKAVQQVDTRFDVKDEYLRKRPARRISATLPQIVSNKLWTQSQSMQMEHDWISESSIRPESPSLYSPSPFSATTLIITDLNDDMFDSASIMTASTKASTVWEISASTPTWLRTKGEFLSLKRNPSTNSLETRKPAMASPSPLSIVADREAELNAKIPKLRRQKSLEKNLRMKDSSTPTKHDPLPALPVASVSHLPEDLERKERSVASKSKSESALADVQKVVRPMISKDQWIADLNSKAVIIGPAFLRKVRPVATEADWAAALTEAVSAGQAIQPKETIIAGKLRVAELEKARPVHNGLWTAPSAIGHESASQLWSQSRSVRDKQIDTAIVTPSERSPRVKRIPTSDLASLQSSQLWNAETDVPFQTNWLRHSSMTLKKASTWTPPSMVLDNNTIEDEKVALWTTSAQASVSSPELNISLADYAQATTQFSPRLPRSLSKRATPLDFPSSTKLFTSSIPFTSPTNWLHTSLTSSTLAAAESLTWTPPSQSLMSSSPKAGLWTPSTIKASITSQVVERIDTSDVRGRKATTKEEDVLEEVNGALWSSKRISAMPLERNWLHSQAWWSR